MNEMYPHWCYQPKKEVKFRGKVTGTEELIGAGHWYVSVDEWISESLPCDEIDVIVGIYPPMGHCDENINKGDRVEVYGEVNPFGSDICTVGLNGESYYIKKIETCGEILDYAISDGTYPPGQIVRATMLYKSLLSTTADFKGVFKVRSPTGEIYSNSKKERTPAGREDSFGYYGDGDVLDIRIPEDASTGWYDAKLELRNFYTDELCDETEWIENQFKIGDTHGICINFDELSQGDITGQTLHYDQVDFVAEGKPPYGHVAVSDFAHSSPNGIGLFAGGSVTANFETPVSRVSLWLGNWAGGTKITLYASDGELLEDVSPAIGDFTYYEFSYTQKISKVVVFSAEGALDDFCFEIGGGSELPDLAVTRLWCNKNPCDSGDDVEIIFDVTNQGSDVAKPCMDCLYIDGSKVAEFDSSGLAIGSELKPGETRTWYYLYEDVPGTPDSHKIKACADCQNSVTESDENNNCKSENLGITDKPDLAVTRLWCNKNPCDSGDDVEIIFDVTNQGSDVAKPCMDCLYIDGSKVAEFDSSGLAIGSELKPGETRTWYYLYEDVPGTPDSHKIKACADCQNSVTESDENNNCKEDTLEVEPKAQPRVHIKGEVVNTQRISISHADLENYCSLCRCNTHAPPCCADYEPKNAGNYLVLRVKIEEIIKESPLTLPPYLSVGELSSFYLYNPSISVSEGDRVEIDIYHPIIAGIYSCVGVLIIPDKVVWDMIEAFKIIDISVASGTRCGKITNWKTACTNVQPGGKFGAEMEFDNLMSGGYRFKGIVRVRSPTDEEYSGENRPIFVPSSPNNHGKFAGGNTLYVKIPEGAATGKYDVKLELWNADTNTRCDDTGWKENIFTVEDGGTGSEIKFTGTAVEHFSGIGAWGWTVRADEIISGPSELQGHTLAAYLASVNPDEYPYGYIDPNIEPEDKVEVYGLYQGEDNVALFGSKDYYIKKSPGGGSIKITSVSPPPGTTLNAGDTVTFTVNVDYDLEQSDYGKIRLSVNQYTTGTTDKEYNIGTFDPHSGSYTFTHTETIWDDWENVYVSVSLYAAKQGEPLPAEYTDFDYKQYPVKGKGDLELIVFDPEIDGLHVKINGVVYNAIKPLHWDWGDGTHTDSWFLGEHTYEEGGSYTITVTAYGERGAVISEKKQVVVSGGVSPY